MEDKNNYLILKKEPNNSNKKSKKFYKMHLNNDITKEKDIDNSYSNKSNNVINFHHFDKVSLNMQAKSNKLIINSEYKKNLSEKFYSFLNKNKFKLSNNFDAKNSKKFLNKKDKCLERIIISDIIEANDSKDNHSLKNIKRRKTIGNKKISNKYFIVITNYDEDKKFQNTPKKRSVNMEKIIKNIEEKPL